MPNTQGGGLYAQSGGSFNVIASGIMTLTDNTQTFRVAQYTAGAHADEGLGTRTGAAAVDGVFTQVLIRKLK